MEDENNFFLTIDDIEFSMVDGVLDVDDCLFPNDGSCPEMYALVKAYWKRITLDKIVAETPKDIDDGKDTGQ